MAADKAVVLVGADATERAVRQQRLSDFQIITFATHAVVPGEIDGVSEPAVILTPGSESNNPMNDGALTASEIASLPLDANVIVLSACNTAGPDNRRSGRGLSGFADAFFFAGARSIVVTQWSVQSGPAAWISQAFVKDVVTQTQVGVAINLQSTLKNFISEARHDYLAHPRFWAAFLVAGDGATRGIA